MSSSSKGSHKRRYSLSDASEVAASLTSSNRTQRLSNATTESSPGRSSKTEHLSVEALDEKDNTSKNNNQNKNQERKDENVSKELKTNKRPRFLHQKSKSIDCIESLTKRKDQNLPKTSFFTKNNRPKNRLKQLIQRNPKRPILARARAVSSASYSSDSQRGKQSHTPKVKPTRNITILRDITKGKLTVQHPRQVSSFNNAGFPENVSTTDLPSTSKSYSRTHYSLATRTYAKTVPKKLPTPRFSTDRHQLPRYRQHQSRIDNKLPKKDFIVRHRSAPPSPAPHDPYLDKIRHIFYIQEDYIIPKSKSIKPLRVYLKSTRIDSLPQLDKRSRVDSKYTLGRRYEEFDDLCRAPESELTPYGTGTRAKEKINLRKNVYEDYALFAVRGLPYYDHEDIQRSRTVEHRLRLDDFYGAFDPLEQRHQHQPQTRLPSKSGHHRVSTEPSEHRLVSERSGQATYRTNRAYPRIHKSLRFCDEGPSTSRDDSQYNKLGPRINTKHHTSNQDPRQDWIEKKLVSQQYREPPASPRHTASAIQTHRLSASEQSATRTPETRKKDKIFHRQLLSPLEDRDYFEDGYYPHHLREFRGTRQEQFTRDTTDIRERQLHFERDTRPSRHMGRMGSLEDHERKIIIEFCHLLEKSKQLFNGLRELPQYGHKQWHSYFGRTFDVYTKLWKFQQQHRGVLDTKYGLKRWQIGEIASKIGQLYYHFYLRTSETAYLNEAFSFYYAIRGRSYYTKACKEDKCELMVKKLRYYARFIVVCLLLKKVKLVRELIKELDRQIVEYGNTYDPDDQVEWTVVVDEVKAFLQAEPVVTVVHPDNYPVILSHRLSPLTTPPVERSTQMSLTLQEVLIVGSSSQQVKFSELTMDMFRMLQTLEREPTGEIQHMYDDSPRQRFNLTPSALNNKGYNLETGAPRCENPHKYLLFKPSPSQILVYLSSGCNDLPPNGALLLYISADGQIVQPSKHPEDVGYDIGGLITTSKNDLYREPSKEQKGSQSKYKESQCLHPGDLYPFTRRPLFVIIDSDNSYVFQNIPRHFGQPLIVLMSPLETPSSLIVTTPDRKSQGSLFTLFLHSPLTAFCHCCEIHNMSLVHWDRAQAYIDTFLAEASQILTRSRCDPMYITFMGDDFLRLLILRFIFCEVVMRMHRAFRARTQLTRASPPLPDDLLEHPALIHIVMDLATHMQVRGTFHDPSAAGPAPGKE